MQYVLGILGIIAGCALIKYRQRVGDEFGDPDWAIHVGGVYNVVIIVGVLVILWSISYMVGTLDFFLSPLLYILPFKKSTKGDGVPLDLNQTIEQVKMIAAAISQYM